MTGIISLSGHPGRGSSLSDSLMAAVAREHVQHPASSVLRHSSGLGLGVSPVLWLLEQPTDMHCCCPLDAVRRRRACPRLRASPSLPTYAPRPFLASSAKGIHTPQQPSTTTARRRIATGTMCLLRLQSRLLRSLPSLQRPIPSRRRSAVSQSTWRWTIVLAASFNLGTPAQQPHAALRPHNNSRRTSPLLPSPFKTTSLADPPQKAQRGVRCMRIGDPLPARDWRR